MTTLRRGGSMAVAAFLLLSGATAGVVGCARGERPRQLGSQAFVNGRGAVDPGRISTEPHSAVDQPGPLVGADQVNRVSVDLMATEEERRRRGRESVQAVSPVVEQAVGSSDWRAGQRGAATQAATAPAAANGGAATRGAAVSGGFLTVGAVVAEVNGTPIFANDVIEAIEAELAAEARNYDAEQFRRVAADAIATRIVIMITEELEYAAAQRELDPREKSFVENRTGAWRQEQITMAGGSLEAARRRFAAAGQDFEEAALDEYRKLMSRWYYQKSIFPRIQVRADDLRQYYERNKDQFTVFDTAQFRWIKIEPRKLGGNRAAALDKAQILRSRAAAGEDFASLARESTDPTIAANGGALPPIQRGAFAIEKVEEAVWKLQPGDVSDVIDTGDAFYIVKLESKEQGSVRPFDDPAVQAEIEETLRRQQFAKLRADTQAEMLKDAIVRGHPRARDYDPAMMRPAVEIAMQRYPVWAAAK